MDLISRQAAIDAIDRFNVCGYVEEPWEKLRDALQALPSAQPEIIRCKDCKYYKDFSCTNDYWYTECLTGDLIGIDVQPWEEFYCYFAERREV